MESPDHQPLRKAPSPSRLSAAGIHARTRPSSSESSDRSPIYKRTVLSNWTRTPPLGFIDPVRRDPAFHFTRPQSAIESLYSSSVVSEDDDDDDGDDEGEGGDEDEDDGDDEDNDEFWGDDESDDESAHEKIRLVRVVEEADASFILEELNSDVSYESGTEIVRPAHVEDAESDRSNSSQKENCLVEERKDLVVQGSSDEEGQRRPYRKKKKRWSSGTFKRSHSQSIEGDSDYSDIDPLDKLDATARRLRRRVRGPYVQTSLVFEDRGFLVANHIPEVEEPEDSWVLHSKGPPSIPSDDAFTLDDLPSWLKEEDVRVADSDDPSGSVSPDKRSPIGVSHKVKRKHKGKTPIRNANYNVSGIVPDPEIVLVAPIDPTARTGSRSISRSGPSWSGIVSTDPKEDAIITSPTMSKPLESISETTPDEQVDSRNQIQEVLKTNTQLAPQPSAASPRRFMSLLSAQTSHFPVLNMEILLTYLRHRTDIMLENFGFREKKIPPGMQRLRWTCSCGKCLYDDFIELQPEALENLRMKLESASKPRQRSNKNNASPGIGNSRSGGFLSRFEHFSWYRQGSNRTPPSASKLPTHNPSWVSAVRSIASFHLLDPLYLLLCINSGKFGVDLHHVHIHHIKCDQALFQFLHKTYGQWRGRLRYTFSLRTVSKIKLVKFATDMSAKVDVYPHSIYCDKGSCSCMPPKSKVEPAPNSEYRCNPIPAPNIPPIGENYMMHLFSSPDCIDQSQVWVYNQVPKRTRSMLMARPEAPVEGWGVHFEEGWHWPRIWTLIMTFFWGGSLLFGVLYAVMSKDAQSAFGIASYWITAATILVGYLATRND